MATCTICGRAAKKLSPRHFYSAWVSSTQSTRGLVTVTTTTTTRYSNIRQHHYHLCPGCVQRAERLRYVWWTLVLVTGIGVGLALLSATGSGFNDAAELLFATLCLGPMATILPIYLLVDTFNPEKQLRWRAKRARGVGRFSQKAEVFSGAEYRAKFGRTR